MAGLFSNPANWKITNTLQRQNGGYTKRDALNAGKVVTENFPLVGNLAAAADAMDLPSKALDPNYDLVPGVSITNRSGQVDVNPFNGGSRGGGASGSWAPQVNGVSTTNQPSNTRSNTGGGTVATAPVKVLDQAQLDSLDSLIQSLATIKDQAVQKGAMKRDTSLREKADEQKQEETKYNGEKLGAVQDFSGALTDTALNTRNTLENLMSSLSVLGLGGSRALVRQILDASNMANRKANTTQAQNNQKLDAAWNSYRAGNENDVKKINDQYGYDEGEANRSYLQGKQNALYKKADVYGAVDDTDNRTRLMNEAGSMNDMIAKSAFMNPTYTGEKKAMETPDLGSYKQDIARYETANIGSDGTSPTPVTSDGMNMPGNLAVRAIAVNNKDLGVKKRTEGELGYGL